MTLGVGLLAAVVVALVAPLNSWMAFPRAAVWATTAAASGLLVWWLCRAGRPGGGGTERRTVWLGVVVGTAVTAVHAALALVPFGWDARRIFESAGTLAGGGALPEEALVYFARYPHNVRLLALEQGAIEAGGVVGLPALASVLVPHVLCVAVVLWALGRACVELGRPRASPLVQALATVLVGLSPNVAVPYTDLPAAAAVAVAAAAMARCVRSWHWGWAVLGAVAMGLGVALKPYAVVLVVAAVLVVLGTRRLRPVLVAGMLGLVVAGTVAAVSTASGAVTGLSQERLAEVGQPFPAEHFLAMGTWDSQEESVVRRWGAYRQEQVDATAAMEPATRAARLREQAWEQVAERGLSGNARFFGAKAVWVWGDGTFWAHGEGADGVAPSSLPQPWSSLADASRGAGLLYPWRAGLVQGVWLGVVLSTAVALLRARPDPLLTTWVLALGGLTAYLMIFEARPRYVLAFVPLLLLVLVRAGLGSADHRPATREAR
ncbi:hypothetical protein [Serinicoccus sediminis]|uniref:hypothetical protein n=1 Tax=Serinicoccus sediminis TaxID=2306021 RepID=UPI0013EA8FFF|nr:hypothetical protein [Serinicoccus sediminis]